MSPPLSPNDGSKEEKQNHTAYQITLLHNLLRSTHIQLTEKGYHVLGYKSEISK
jgi:hypothetical protein